MIVKERRYMKVQAGLYKEILQPGVVIKCLLVVNAN